MVQDSVSLAGGADQRRFWLDLLLKIAQPVLEAASAGQFHRRAPFRGRIDGPPAQNTALETCGRLLSGMAPWLALEIADADERSRQRAARDRAIAAVDHGTRPGGSDRWNFDQDDQPCVDAAYLSHAVLRAPDLFIRQAPSDVKRNLVAALLSNRVIPPYPNNWLLFSAMTEAALDLLGERPDLMRVDYAIEQFEQWYIGDGLYKDGPVFHMDYYNSFVIHPMLADLVEYFASRYGRYKDRLDAVRQRAGRYAAILERSVSPEGTYPAVGRSIAYRFGAMYALAHAAFAGLLPAELSAAQARCALTAVTERFARCHDLFDADGWLQVGFCGHQPKMGEYYISGSSCYLCVNALVPLGLPPQSPFWADPPTAWTCLRLWSGQTAPIDHALGHFLKPRPFPVPAGQTGRAGSGEDSAPRRP